MDAVWDQWNLICDPEGCDIWVQVLRVIVWGYFGIALVIFFVAIRAWTTSLHPVLGFIVAAVGSYLIVRTGRSYIASTGSLRALGYFTAIGLVAVLVGKPKFLERKRTDDAPSTGDPKQEEPQNSATQ